MDWNTVRYVEPFLGSGAILLQVQALRQGRGPTPWASDINKALVDAHRAIRDAPAYVDEFLAGRLCHLNAADRPGREKIYQRWVTEFNEARSSQTRQWSYSGALMVLLNRICFNGLFRMNAQGHFNVPLGRPAASSNRFSFDNKRMMENHRLLRGVQLRTGGYRSVLRRVLADRARCVVYLDPPYACDRRGFTGYHSTTFGWDDQVYLAEMATKLVDDGHLVLVSNGSNPMIADLYDGTKFAHLELERYASVSGTGSGRGQYQELLVVGGA